MPRAYGHVVFPGGGGSADVWSVLEGISRSRPAQAKVSGAVPESRWNPRTSLRPLPPSWPSGARTTRLKESTRRRASAPRPAGDHLTPGMTPPTADFHTYPTTHTRLPLGSQIGPQTDSAQRTTSPTEMSDGDRRTPGGRTDRRRTTRTRHRIRPPRPQTTAARSRYGARKPKAPRPAPTPRWPTGHGSPRPPAPLPTFVIAPIHTTGIS